MTEVLVRAIVAGLPALPDVRAALEDALVEVAGGFTVWPCRGAWRDPAGRRHDDDGLVYEVLTTTEVAPRIADLIGSHAWLAGQLAIVLDIVPSTAQVVSLDRRARPAGVAR